MPNIGVMEFCQHQFQLAVQCLFNWELRLVLQSLWDPPPTLPPTHPPGKVYFSHFLLDYTDVQKSRRKMMHPKRVNRNEVKKIWNKRCTQGMEFASQCKDLALDHHPLGSHRQTVSGTTDGRNWLHYWCREHLKNKKQESYWKCEYIFEWIYWQWINQLGIFFLTQAFF